MSYTPLIHPDHIVRQVNPFAASPSISELLNRCFDSDILPGRAQYPRRFPRKEIFADLYSSSRGWRDPIEFGSDDAERHENYLHHLFWNPKLANPVICVIGPVGSGKSTLVDYYLRCHCPDNSANAEDFEKKLIVHFDAIVVQDNTDFYHLFFLSAQASIRVQCDHRNFDIDLAIKRRPTQPNNVREWVWAAFEELSRVAKRDDPSAPFQYITLVVDNLDQTPPPVQIRAITEVEQWLLNPRIRLWRVFLPLWPSTFSYLRNHRFNMLRGVNVFEIGPLDNDILVNDHALAIETQLRASGTSLDHQATEFLTDITRFASKRLLHRILALSHGSLRLMLSLWGGFLRSEIAHGIWRQRKAAPDSPRGYEYELLDALIVGDSEALDQRRHRVANLFVMGHAHARPRDLLIGPHVMVLMSQGYHRQATLTEALLTLGYSPNNIRDAVTAFSAFNILHQVPTPGGAIDYELHDSVIREYMLLIWEPAYVDNVAMVTPVDPSILPRMHKTRGVRAEDFMDRVETTLTFLRFLRSCEDSFRDPTQLRPGVDPGAFRESLTRLRLPSLWRGMAASYRSRLGGLKNSGYLKNVDLRWWVHCLSDPLLLESEKASEFLVPS